MSEKDFDQLVAAWLDGRLSEQDSLVLQTELRSSASARTKFRKYAQLDVALHEFADTSGLLTPEQLVASALGGSNAEQGKVALASAGSTHKLTSLLGWFPALSVGIAATMLLAVTYLYTRDSSADRLGNPDRSETVANAGSEGDSQEHGKSSERSVRRPPAPVATLAAAKEAVWEDSQLEIGQALYESETVNLKSGDARISVGFGAEIVAEAPCSLTFLANDRVRLNHGEVAVDVASWAKGFTIVTEEMDIVDLGTTFTVSASPGVRSETTVLKGLVRVHPTKSQEKQRRGLLVTEGQQVSVDGNGLLKNAQPEAAQQRLADLDFGVSQPYRPVKLNNTGIGLAVGDEDQHWRVVAGPDGAFQGEEFATVCVPHERYLENDPSASQWISIADWTTAPANSVYTFQTEFDLEGYDLSTMQLFGRFLADNGIAAV
ncbi:MAG: FecR domain-containing protein, partial [Lacipirellulaceae bacterium]